MRKYILKNELKNGAYYKGICRNASVARWNAETGKFVHHRAKFGHTFLEEICHPEDDMKYDVFYPEREMHIDEVENPIEFRE